MAIRGVVVLVALPSRRRAKAAGFENGFGVETPWRAKQLFCFGKWQSSRTLATRLDSSNLVILPASCLDLH